jgi:hypothetical protein
LQRCRLGHRRAENHGPNGPDLRLVTCLEADSPYARLFESRVPQFILCALVCFVAQLDDRDDLAASGADDVIDALLGDPLSVAIGCSLAATRRVEHGRHRRLRNNVVVGKRHDESAEEFFLVIGPELATSVRTSVALS